MSGRPARFGRTTAVSLRLLLPISMIAACLLETAPVADAATINEFAIPTASSGPTEIAVGRDGTLWFLERNANKIGRVTTSGVVTAEFPVPTPSSGLHGIASVGKALWFTEENANAIGVDGCDAAPQRGEGDRGNTSQHQ